MVIRSFFRVCAIFYNATFLYHHDFDELYKRCGEQTVNAVLDKLEENGLIFLDHDECDHFYRVTTKGRHYFNNLQKVKRIVENDN